MLVARSVWKLGASTGGLGGGGAECTASGVTWETCGPGGLASPRSQPPRAPLAPCFHTPFWECSRRASLWPNPKTGDEGRARAEMWGKPGPRASTSPEAPRTRCIPPPLPAAGRNRPPKPLEPVGCGGYHRRLVLLWIAAVLSRPPPAKRRGGWSHRTFAPSVAAPAPGILENPAALAPPRGRSWMGAGWRWGVQPWWQSLKECGTPDARSRRSGVGRQPSGEPVDLPRSAYPLRR